MSELISSAARRLASFSASRTAKSDSTLLNVVVDSVCPVLTGCPFARSIKVKFAINRTLEKVDVESFRITRSERFSVRLISSR